MLSQSRLTSCSPAAILRASLLTLAFGIAPALADSQAPGVSDESMHNAATQQPSANEGGAQSLLGAETDDPAISAPIIIEADPMNEEPTLDQLMHRFREALGAPPSYVISERPLGGEGLEFHTRYGRFCVKTPAVQMGGPGGDVTLASRCASF
ncbi:MAG: hypothetical protein ABI612_04080 [Betaproteobacteria bacterium]